jgi:hypothetical protein
VSKLLSALGAGKRKRPRGGGKTATEAKVEPEEADTGAAGAGAGAGVVVLPGSIRLGVACGKVVSEQVPLPDQVMCRCETFEELVECVRFMQANDEIARTIAAQGYERIGRNMLSRDAIASRVRDALVASGLGYSAAGAAGSFSDTTHPLFGISNIDYVSKGLVRKVNAALHSSSPGSLPTGSRVRSELR